MLISDETENAGSGTLMIHLLGRCNLRCDHCYMEGAPDRAERLPLEPVLDAIAECPALGIGTLFVTGGEPLLYPELKSVLEAAAQVPGLTTTLCTNGTKLTQPLADWIAERRIRLNISIDGDADYHDAFRRRRHAFAGAQRGVDRAVAAGCHVTIITTVTQRNLGMVPGLVQWAVDRGAKTFRAQPLLKLGRGSAMENERLTASQLDHLILTLSDLANRNREAIHCSIIGQSRRFLQAHPCAAYVCNGGGCHRRIEKEIKKVVVREDGLIVPESTNLDRAYRIGMLGEAPLSAMVNAYMDRGYAAFDRLCRTAYAELVPDWPLAVVPWDQIIAERSRLRVSGEVPAHGHGCGGARTAAPALAGAARSRDMILVS